MTKNKTLQFDYLWAFYCTDTHWQQTNATEVQYRKIMSKKQQETSQNELLQPSDTSSLKNEQKTTKTSTWTASVAQLKK